MSDLPEPGRPPVRIAWPGSIGIGAIVGAMRDVAHRDELARDAAMVDAVRFRTALETIARRDTTDGRYAQSVLDGGDA